MNLLPLNRFCTASKHNNAVKQVFINPPSLTEEIVGMAQNEVKEAFVSNLNGTSLGEVTLGSFLAPVCLIHRAFILVLYHQAKGTLPLPLPLISHLLLDFSVLVLPLVLSCTILSDVLLQVIVCLTFISACVLCYICRTSFQSSALQSQKIVSNFLQSSVQFHQVPFVTLFRVFVNVKTAISILAVDFSVFPRRYAKTETYGTGVMDFGVGAFVFANALVSPEARRREVTGSKMSHVTKQILSVWPLLALGLGRLVSIKMTGYHEHVTEYGIHWNFFFTLAIVRVLASVLLAVLPAGQSWLFALLISGCYQFALETSELKTFLMHNKDREKNFVHANKEGIFSIAGYVAIYLAGVQIGLYVMQQRHQVKDCLKMVFTLSLGSLLSYGALFACQTLVEPVSRRSANLPFVIWSVAQSLFFMSCLGLADMVILFSKGASACRFLPSSINFLEKKTDSPVSRSKVKVERLCLIQAISRNQLVFFLLSNVMTGATNSVVDTLSCSSSFSVCVLLSYMLVNCLVIYVLHICEITVKFW